MTDCLLKSDMYFYSFVTVPCYLITTEIMKQVRQYPEFQLALLNPIYLAKKLHLFRNSVCLILVGFNNVNVC